MEHESLARQLYRGGGFALCYNAALLAALLLCLLTPRPLVAVGLVVGCALGGAAGGCAGQLHYRFTRGVPIFGPPNHCPACRVTLKARHTAPVVGWFLTRGRCASCSTPIPRRYLVAELGGATAGMALSVVAAGLLR